MYTQCPHCQTCFRIAEAHLKVANGKVRCGSCQEVFDATQHLFKNLNDREPITDYQQPAPSPSKQAGIPPEETDHIDLNQPSRPNPQAVEKILREREKAPAQDQFMESTIDNTRYNDLDNMGTIDIPGDINFSDSSIKFTEDKKAEPPAEKAGAEPDKSGDTRTPYEDIESKEAPTTTAEQETLKNFFAEVDAQLNEDESKSQSQLDKDIDELLAFAKGHDTEPGQPLSADKAKSDATGIEVSEEFDLDAVADFEKELEASSAGVFNIEQPADMPPPEPKSDEPQSSQPAKATAPEQREDSTRSGNQADTAKDETDLPAPEENIPHALRRSLEMLDQTPRRSLGKTLLMSLLILLLLGGLGFQVVLFRNVALAQMYPKLIPVLTQVCNRIPCRYSGKVDVSQIKLINRDVRSDPKHPNALLISATFVDQAPFDQPYPIIKITLYDLGGNVVASRRFTPKEYLQKMYNRFLLMESGTPVHVTLAVLDPGKDAINFEFSFL